MTSAEQGETAVESSPAPAPTGAIRWERRRVTCLRLMLVPTDEESERRQYAVLEEVRQKILGFGGVI